ncbi:hypothetical protein NQ315_012365, partial [Exocentrus adspersus]
MEYIFKKAEEARQLLLPNKSEALYRKEYQIYLKWLEIKKYYTRRRQPNGLLGLFIRNEMETIQEKRDITKFNELEAFLKRKSKNYKPKKSAVLCPKDVVRFLKEAPDEIHLLHKVVLIMGYFGGCRTQELFEN